MSLQNRGSDFVEGICSTTGYPTDRYDHLLNPYHPLTGELEKDWDQPGTELIRLTNPCGLLIYVVGDWQDFWCFEYALIQKTTSTGFLVLDIQCNSETGGFLENIVYDIIPWNNWDNQTRSYTERALTWCAENGIEHDTELWSQDPFFFHRCVATDMKDIFLSPDQRQKFAHSQYRFGDKQINFYTDLKELI